MHLEVGALTLFMQRQSPYCRKVRVHAAQCNIDRFITLSEQNTSPITNNSIVNTLNPLGKVPILQHDDLVILDSPLICDYLHSISEKMGLTISEEISRERVKRIEALGDGISDSGLLVKQENERDMSGGMNHHFREGHLQKIYRTMRFIEADTEFFQESTHMGHIAVAVALDWLGFAKIDIGLNMCPKLSEWLKNFKSKASMKKTSYSGTVDDGFVLQGLIEQVRQDVF